MKNEEGEEVLLVNEIPHIEMIGSSDNCGDLVDKKLINVDNILAAREATIKIILEGYQNILKDCTNVSGLEVCLTKSQTCHAAMLGGSTLVLLELGLWPLTEESECSLSPRELVDRLLNLSNYGMHPRCSNHLWVNQWAWKNDIPDPTQDKDIEHMRIQAGKFTVSFESF